MLRCRFLAMIVGIRLVPDISIPSIFVAPRACPRAELLGRKESLPATLQEAKSRYLRFLTQGAKGFRMRIRYGRLSVEKIRIYWLRLASTRSG